MDPWRPRHPDVPSVNVKDDTAAGAPLLHCQIKRHNGPGGKRDDSASAAEEEHRGQGKPHQHQRAGLGDDVQHTVVHREGVGHTGGSRVPVAPKLTVAPGAIIPPVAARE